MSKRKRRTGNLDRLKQTAIGRAIGQAVERRRLVGSIARDTERLAVVTKKIETEQAFMVRYRQLQALAELHPELAEGLDWTAGRKAPSLNHWWADCVEQRARDRGLLPADQIGTVANAKGD